MIRVFEAFAGIGSQRMALKSMGIEHEVVAISEKDKYAENVYNAIHGETYNMGDITRLNIIDIPDHDLFTYSFPCQDISSMGFQLGAEKGSGTRSSLLWECQKIIRYKKPKYLLLENIRNLVGWQHKENFDKWLDWLSEQGYTNYWQILNAKDYGAPQNRERVFVVSILGESDFIFPEKVEPIPSLNDILEENPSERLYLSRKVSQSFRDELSRELNANSRTGLKTYSIKMPILNRKHSIGNKALPKALKKAKKESKLSTKEIADRLGVSKSKVDHWFRQGEYFVPPDSELWYDFKEMIGFDTDRYDKQIMEFEESTGKYSHLNRVYDTSGVCPTLTTKIQPLIKEVQGNHYRVRKMSIRECWRAMGFSDSDFDKIPKEYTDSRLLHLIGNSIAVPVLEKIFTEMLKSNES